MRRAVDGRQSLYRFRGLVSLLVLALFALLLFARLGHYALWDDEADVALFARNLWRYGDLFAWDGKNLVAYREGLSLLGLKNRLYPPLQYLVAAPFIGFFGENSLAARLPFALVALCGFALWGRWLRRENASGLTQLSTVLLVLGNVSLFLYSRQARHYSLSWVLSLGVVYCYVYRSDSQLRKLFLVFGSGLLLVAHYMSYGSLMVCLGVDYLLFELRKKNDRWIERVIYLGMQLVFVALLVVLYELTSRDATSYVPLNWYADKLTLFWWNLRDQNACEFLWLPILPLALVVFALGRGKDLWLLRGVIAMVLYAFVSALLSPQPVGQSNVADIRYMSPTIPLGIFITVRTLTNLPRLAWQVALVMVGCLSFTSVPCAVVQYVLCAPTSISVRSTLFVYLKELAYPQRSAYEAVSHWLNSQTASSKLVLVQPDYAVYPLQFHAPQHRYMWLLRPDQRPDYPTLPDYVFRDQGVPDIVVAFGADVGNVRSALSLLAPQGIRFAPEVALNVAGPDKTRPELFWRDFATRPPANPDMDGTYIFQRIP